MTDMTEWDRLRAVVEAAREFAEVTERPGPHDDPATQAAEYVATRRALIQAVSALDGSAVIGEDNTEVTDGDPWSVAFRRQQDTVRLRVGTFTITLSALSAHKLGSALHAASGIDSG